MPQFLAATYLRLAERKAGNDKFWGFVWQGRAYEGLTCNGLEWVASHNGGSIIEPDSKITINNPQAVKALNQAKPWVNTISPPGVLNYTEEESRGVFQAGNALFMRNWPYAWGLSQGADSPVKGKVSMNISANSATRGNRPVAINVSNFCTAVTRRDCVRASTTASAVIRPKAT